MRNLFQSTTILMIGLSLSACNIYDDCSDIACFTPPAPVYFQLYSDVNEDLLANEAFEEIDVTNLGAVCKAAVSL